MIRYFILAFMTGCMLVSPHTKAHIFSSIREHIPTIPTWLTSTKEIKTVHKKYSLSPNSTIHIYNTRGSVTIETKWDQESDVLLTAELQSPNRDQLKEVVLKHNTKDNNLSIKTCHVTQKNQTVVNYTLVIPGEIGVHIVNDEGNITITNVRGPIVASTTKGTITINDPHNSTVAKAQQGAITVFNPLNSVKATTQRGAITITNSKGSVLARTQKGAIDLQATEIPDHSAVKLATNSGAITVCLPDTINAALQATSERGVVLCEHEITINPRITTLDAQAWRLFKRSITGTIGNSMMSKISLRSMRSNINILKDNTTT